MLLNNKGSELMFGKIGKKVENYRRRIIVNYRNTNIVYNFLKEKLGKLSEMEVPYILAQTPLSRGRTDMLCLTHEGVFQVISPPDFTEAHIQSYFRQNNERLLDASETERDKWLLFNKMPSRLNLLRVITTYDKVNTKSLEELTTQNSH